MDCGARHTCLRLEIEDKEVIFIKGTWFHSHFELSITNGFDSWICNASETEVLERSKQWDQPLSEYIETAEQYLGFQQAHSSYSFVDTGNGHRRLSWTFEKQGTKLEWRWKCQPSANPKQATAEILDFLMDANIRLSEEVVRKAQSYERLKVEAEKCLVQSEKLKNEKVEFESTIYAKFVGVLNSKKAKLRELRDRLEKQETKGKSPQEDEESTDGTELYEGGNDDGEKSKEEAAKNLLATTATATSKNTATTMSQGQKRKTRM